MQMNVECIHRELNMPSAGLALTLRAVLDEDTSWQKAHPWADDRERDDAPYNAFCESLKPYEGATFARPVKGWNDVAEIAMIALFWTQKESMPGDDHDQPYSFALGRDSERDSDYRDERSRAALIRAAGKIVLEQFGGANV